MVDPKNEREYLQQLCMEVLSTSAYEDNPKDRNRTIANMQMASIYYIDDRLKWMDHWPIYVENPDDPQSMVGIEQVFDICVNYADGKVIRYIGTIDGCIYHAKHGEFALDENKTASRLSDGWRLSFDMSHQVTGYCIASSHVFGFPVNRVRVLGVKIPPTAAENTYQGEPLERNEEDFRVWANWLRRTVEVYETYKNNYEGADRYTHSCNRYFRPCSLLAFCTDSVEGRREQWTQMVDADMSPSEYAVMEDL